PAASAAAGAPEPLDHAFPLPRPPDHARHVLRHVDLRQVFPFVNPGMLYGKHLGLRGDLAKLLDEKDETAVKVHAVVEELQTLAAREGILEAHAVYRWFPATAEDGKLVLFDPDAPAETVAETFTFRRQPKAPRRALSDYVRPRGAGQTDSVCLFVVTAGRGVRERAEKWKDEGEYLKSHALSALALETAEALAEVLHRRIRTQWGIADEPGLTAKDLFKGKYRGRRYSFGYPACPELADQQKLFRLLAPEDVGVRLTEGFMMDPEASVSAVVFHHPAAEYYAV
ncbi:MAG TPA: vitamin B12 dependent-methionine synthase activation domain-containing protein, partial [Candidatus Thermoplasmatota archaeon]|nr:vitamin B12 dependent-methionine synthase activation domain-containing protein [Candidatus Thermoplasmatota archaeon]